MKKVYLAGPDVFLPDALEAGRRKVAICAQYGLSGLYPLDNTVDLASHTASLDIFRGNETMMDMADAIIANLTPFGGASADAGTLIEVGWFLGRGKPIFAYSNVSESFEQRMRRQLGDGCANLGIEGFHLPDNLMIAGAVSSGGCPIFVPRDGKARGIDALDVFEACAAAAANVVGDQKGR